MAVDKFIFSQWRYGLTDKVNYRGDLLSIIGVNLDLKSKIFWGSLWNFQLNFYDLIIDMGMDVLFTSMRTAGLSANNLHPQNIGIFLIKPLNTNIIKL